MLAAWSNRKKMLTKLSMAGKQFRNLHSLASVSRRSYCPGKNKSGKLMSISSKILTPYWKHRFVLISHFDDMTNFTCSLIFTELFFIYTGRVQSKAG